MDDVTILFRFTDSAFGLTGWGVVWTAFLAWLAGRN